MKIRRLLARMALALALFTSAPLLHAQDAASDLKALVDQIQVKLKAGKRTIEVPDRSTPVGYDVRPGKRPRELPESRRPTCT